MSEVTPLRPTLAPEALDFAPDLLAIQERPPERLPRLILWCVVALVALLLVWALLAKLDIIATAQGRLVPVGFTKVVQPADAGVVSEILVRDGDKVRAGQVLLRLDPRLTQADSQALATEAALRRLSLAHADAELAQRPITAVEAPKGLAAQVESQYRARRDAYADAVAQEREALNKAQADLRVAQQVHAKLEQTLPVFQQTADSYQKLVKQGFVGELVAAEKQRESTERAYDLEAQKANIASLQAAIAQSERKLASLRSQYRSQLENERIDTIGQLNRIEQEHAKARVRVGMLEIRAPVDGVVKDLAVTTQGAVVPAGAVLLSIVPVDEALQAEVLLENEDIGFAAVGQPVRLKVLAYPFQKYGLLDGRIAMLSADAAETKPSPGTAPQSAQQPLAYRALVRLDSGHLDSAAAGEKLPLNAGMLVVAEVHQGRRSVMEYLLSPVRRVAQEAARER